MTGARRRLLDADLTHAPLSCDVDAVVPRNDANAATATSACATSATTTIAAAAVGLRNIPLYFNEVDA